MEFQGDKGISSSAKVSNRGLFGREKEEGGIATL